MAKSEIEVTVNEKAKTITIVLPINEAPSSSGKSTVIASTRGNLRTGVNYKGKEITIGVNAYVPK